MEETLFEVRDQLSRSGVVNSDLAVPLFDSLLRVALAEVSSSPDPPEEKSDRVSPASGETVSEVTAPFCILKFFTRVSSSGYSQSGIAHLILLQLQCVLSMLVKG